MSRTPKKTVTTTISARLTRAQVRALKRLAAEEEKNIGDMVADAVMKVYGKQLKALIKEQVSHE